MRKIINWKKYDTETAEQLASYWNELSTRDFRHMTERLFRKKTGEYFLYGEGGPLSKYATRCGGSGFTGGEDIVPLSEQEAKELAEKHLGCDEYEAIFGEVEEYEVLK